MSKSHEQNIMDKTKELPNPFTAMEIYILVLMDKKIKHKPPFRKVVRTLYESSLYREKIHGHLEYRRQNNGPP